MTENNQNTILEEALRLRDEGVSAHEILTKFPEEKELIEGLFQTIEFLQNEGSQIKAPERLLERALHRDVTKMSKSGYTGGRGTSRASTKITLDNILTTMNRKVLLPIGAIVLVLVIFGVAQYGGGQTSLTSVADLEALGAEIDTELTAVEFDSELESFLEEEANLEELDLLLSEF